MKIFRLKKKIILIIAGIMVLATIGLVTNISKNAKKDEKTADTLQSMKTIEEKKEEKDNKADVKKETKQEVKDVAKNEQKIEEAKEEVKKEEVKNEEVKQEAEPVNNEEPVIEEVKAEEKQEEEDKHLDDNTPVIEEEVQRPLARFLINGLDTNIVFDNKMMIPEELAREIAEYGFKRATRIVGEEITNNKKTETVKIENVSPNNFFVKQDNEKNIEYKDVIRTCYSITRKDDMISGITIYVDTATGIIIGARTFGD